MELADLKGKNITLSPALYVVSTPLGNLEDITLRAINVLSSCDVIAAEDTRRTKILLDHYGITTPKICSYHNYSERSKASKFINYIKEDNFSVALVSDAGTPSICDPGYHIINGAYSNNISVISIPGACSLISLASVSGFSLQNFTFVGFLPDSEKKLVDLFSSWESKNSPIIFFESPKSIVKTLIVLCKILHDWDICIGRELTKVYEQIIRGRVEDILEKFVSGDVVLKGEFVVIVKKRKLAPQELSLKLPKDIDRLLDFLISLKIPNKSILDNIPIPKSFKKKDIYEILVKKKSLSKTMS
jgi:16S rRNA (cytidine1402-2'-O)-methyltransferase